MRMPSRIIDAHHHLWDLRANHYPWLMARGQRRFFGDPTPIQKDYLPSDLRADIGPLPVRGSVHVQVGIAAGAAVDETEWLQAQSQASGLPTAIVAYVDLAAPDADAELHRHARSSALRGVRQIIGRHPVEDAAATPSRLLHDARWRENLALLAPRGLSFDLQVIPSQLEDAHEVFSRCPDLSVAICHAGSPGAEPGRYAEWRNGMALWAGLPRAYCKFSGCGMFDAKWSAASARRHFDTIIELFGTSRVMFGSNFPVERLARSYTDVWGDYFELGRAFGDRALSEMCHDNAQRFYRL